MFSVIAAAFAIALDAGTVNYFLADAVNFSVAGECCTIVPATSVVIAAAIFFFCFFLLLVLLLLL